MQNSFSSEVIRETLLDATLKTFTVQQKSLCNRVTKITLQQSDLNTLAPAPCRFLIQKRIGILTDHRRTQTQSEITALNAAAVRLDATNPSALCDYGYFLQTVRRYPARLRRPTCGRTQAAGRHGGFPSQARTWREGGLSRQHSRLRLLAENSDAFFSRQCVRRIKEGRP